MKITIGYSIGLLCTGTAKNFATYPRGNPNRMEGKMENRILNTGSAEICEGCKHSPWWCATGYACSVYSDPRKTFGYRNGECAFNQKRKLTKKSKVRVGQQKQKGKR